MIKGSWMIHGEDEVPRKRKDRTEIKLKKKRETRDGWKSWNEGWKRKGMGRRMNLGEIQSSQSVVAKVIDSYRMKMEAS